MIADSPTVLTSLNSEALEARLAELGQPRFRTKQILEWVYRKQATSFEEMTNLSADLRETLSQEFTLRSMTLTKAQGSEDTTRKFLFRLHDGRYIESVLIPASVAKNGERADRRTLCVSSQVGCAYGCKFCASGLAGFARNLSVDEIVEQVIQAEEVSGQRVNNMVFMGMGEPLANLTNLLRAIEIINEPWGLEIGARHLTISTSGLVPQIRKLADQPIQLRLAVSLHGASDPVRDQIMPINEKYPIAKLFDALRYFNSRKKQKITFEYILIDEVNDMLSEAELLAKHAKSLHAKVNLIPYNKVDGLEWRRPSETRQKAFLGVLKRAGVQCTLRIEKGHDIDAACGQLRLKEEKGGLISEAV